MMATWSKEHVFRFIERYRSLESLWRVKSNDYSNRLIKERSYHDLVTFVRTFDKEATKDCVLKKINNLRTCFRKELKKVENSKFFGARPDEIYVPKLWYFNTLMFLKDQETTRSYGLDGHESNQSSENEQYNTETLWFIKKTTRIPPFCRYPSPSMGERTLPALWKVKSKEYSNKLSRELAYLKLREFCQKFHPSADKQFVVNKINNLRGAFRKEIRKEETSKLSGAGRDDIYESKLWYFPHLMFIRDQEVPGTGMSNLDNENTHPSSSSPNPTHSLALESEIPKSPKAEVDFLIEYDDEQAQEESSPELSQSSSVITPRQLSAPKHVSRESRRSYKRKADEDELHDIDIPRQRLADNPPPASATPMEDVHDAYGKLIAHKMRSLPREQRIHAQKLFADILYEAELGNLSRNNVMCSPEPSSSY